MCLAAADEACLIHGWDGYKAERSGDDVLVSANENGYDEKTYYEIQVQECIQKIIKSYENRVFEDWPIELVLDALEVRICGIF